MASTRTAAAAQVAAIQELRDRLETAKSFEEIKDLRGKAEAIRSYAQSAKLGIRLQNEAAEAKIIAERKAGRVLASLNLRGGDRRSRARGSALKLRDLGVSRNDSASWQREAEVPERIFQRYICRAKRRGDEITTASFLRVARHYSGAKNKSVRRQARSGLHVPAKSENLLEAYRHLLSMQSIVERVCDDETAQVSPAERHCMLRYVKDVIAALQRVSSEGSVNCSTETNRIIVS